LILDWDLVISTRFYVCYEFKIWKLIYGVFERLLYYLFIEVIFEESCFELEKSIFGKKSCIPNQVGRKSYGLFTCVLARNQRVGRRRRKDKNTLMPCLLVYMNQVF
jgi:hypothetical protein